MNKAASGERRRPRNLAEAEISRWRLLALSLLACEIIPSASGFLSAPRRQDNAFFGRQHSEAVLSDAASCDRTRRRAAIVSRAVVSSPAAALLDFDDRLNRMYENAGAIKCPFFRRRAADLIDGAAMLARFLLIRHKSLPGLSDLFLDAGAAAPGDGRVADVLSCPGCKPLGRHIKRRPDGTAEKTRGLPLADVARRVAGDWTGGNGGATKGYYITGRLDSTVYRDNCLFTGPDPDMPVRGLRKYLSAAAHLFDPRESDAELLSIAWHENAGARGCGQIEVRWRLGGVIQLPWHPRMEPWTGITRYHLDEEQLICLHEETWDISVWRAFTCTLFPALN